VDWSVVTRFLEAVGAWLLNSGIKIALVLTAMMISIRAASLLSQRLLTRLEQRSDDPELHKKVATLESVVQYLISTVIVAVGATIVLRELGIDIRPVLAAAGVVGVAVGFGAQNLVRDLIAGFLILLEDEVRVGDVVEIAGKSGDVERVDLHMITLRDDSGNVHYIRNGQIDTVTNKTKDFSFSLFEIRVAYHESVDEVLKVLAEIDTAMRTDAALAQYMLEPIEIFGLDQVTNAALVITARTKTPPGKQWAVGREFNRRLKQRFDELGIEMAFPHMTLYTGEGSRQ